VINRFAVSSGNVVDLCESFGLARTEIVMTLGSLGNIFFEVLFVIYSSHLLISSFIIL
jgi:predicted RecA/RadA family phage recombinase